MRELLGEEFSKRNSYQKREFWNQEIWKKKLIMILTRVHVILNYENYGFWLLTTLTMILIH